MIHIIKWKTDREREKGERTKMITADRLSYVQMRNLVGDTPK